MKLVNDGSEKHLQLTNMKCFKRSLVDTSLIFREFQTHNHRNYEIWPQDKDAIVVKNFWVTILEQYSSTKSLWTRSENEAEEKEENDNGRDRENDEKNKGKNSY